MHTRNRLLAALISGVFAATSLAVAPPANANGCVGSNFPSGDGSTDAPFEIADAGDLTYLASDFRCFIYVFRQSADIALTGTWTPIGNSTNAFTGTYNGNGFSISNVTVSAPTADNVGLFGAINGAALTGINVVSGSITGYDNVGGLVGQATNSTVNRSASAISVSGRHYIGGLAGSLSSTPVTDSYATGSVTGSFQVGGLIGENDSSTLTHVYATGLVTAGGLLNAQGGLMGQQSGGSYSGVTWDIETTGQTQSENSRNVVPTGSTTAEMKQIDNFTSRGWSIGSSWTGSTTWVICPQVNDGYPFLSIFYTQATAPCQTAGEDLTIWSLSILRDSATAECLTGYTPSWAQWPYGATGGWVCNRDVYAFRPIPIAKKE